MVDSRLYDGIIMNMIEHIISHFKERIYTQACPSLELIHIQSTMLSEQFQQPQTASDITLLKIDWIIKSVT